MSVAKPAIVFEQAYRRQVLFALELIDAVSLQRVSSGVKPIAEGLRGTPIVNHGGLFVWLHEDLAALRRITIDTGSLSLHADDIDAADLQLPLTTLQLSPTAGYAFAAGPTVVRSALLESNGGERVAMANARMRLTWLDDNGLTWHDAPTASRTGPRGDFAALLRLTPSDLPLFDANGQITVRLAASRSGDTRERFTSPFQIPQGRVTDTPVLAWDDLQP
jgi:hypothetical protein